MLHRTLTDLIRLLYRTGLLFVSNVLCHTFYLVYVNTDGLTSGGYLFSGNSIALGFCILFSFVVKAELKQDTTESTSSKSSTKNSLDENFCSGSINSPLSYSIIGIRGKALEVNDGGSSKKVVTVIESSTGGSGGGTLPRQTGKAIMTATQTTPSPTTSSSSQGTAAPSPLIPYYSEQSSVAGAVVSKPVPAPPIITVTSTDDGRAATACGGRPLDARSTQQPKGVMDSSGMVITCQKQQQQQQNIVVFLE
uniref:Uncharacterized protein n=1 Tax=Anopheles melas TaxID=34690 RepID=A0A182TMH1_9DIPT